MKKLTMILTLAMILCFMVGCQDKKAMAKLEKFKAQAALEEQNKEIVKRFFEELNKGNIEIYEELCTPDYGFYQPSNTPKPMSREETKEFIKMILKTFPDVKWNIKEIFAAGDRVIVWFINTGTHEGEFQGIPATGNKVEVGTIVIYRIKNGQIVEEKEEFNALGLMMQLGMEFKPKEAEK